MAKPSLPTSPPPSAAAVPPARELKELTRLIQRAPGFPEVLAALKNGRSGTIDGAWGSACPLTVAGLGLHAPKTLIIVMAHVGDVDDFRDDVATFAGAMPEVFPAWEKLPKGRRAGRRGLRPPVAGHECSGRAEPASIRGRADAGILAAGAYAGGSGQVVAAAGGW